MLIFTLKIQLMASQQRVFLEEHLEAGLRHQIPRVSLPGGKGDPYHELLDGGMLVRLPAGHWLLVHDLHADVVLGGHHPLEICAPN